MMILMIFYIIINISYDIIIIHHISIIISCDIYLI